MGDKRGFAWNIRLQSDPEPDINNPDVEFWEEAYPGEPLADAQARLDTLNGVSRKRNQITDLTIVGNTGGGGGGSPQIIAGNYSPGVSITPESGIDLEGTSWSSGTAILN